MTDRTTGRFHVLIGPEDYANHILDMADVELDGTLNEAEEMLLELAGVQSNEEPDDLDEFMEAFLSMGWETPGELVCNHGVKFHRADLVSFTEYADGRALDEIDFEGDAPEGMCSYCWSGVRKTLDEEAELEEKGIVDKIGTVGYRLRWKQKGRAREEWYDIVVRPGTTMAELDSLVCQFTTLDDFHLRMYGLEDEYLSSSLNVLPDNQYEQVGDRSYTKASEMTIAEVAERATLWEGDRLSLVYDFGTPSHYYCIVKEIYEPEELDSLLTTDDLVAETETAAIVDQKHP